MASWETGQVTRRLLLLAPLCLVLALAVVFYFGMHGADRSRLPSALLGKKFPEFELPLLRSGELSTHRLLEGKPRLVNVWATWCAECRVEHETLNAIARDGEIEIVGLNYRDDPEKALGWLQDLGNPYEFTIVDADGNLGVDLGVYGAPESFLLDSQRVIVFKHIGAMTPEIWDSQFMPLLEAMRRG